MSQNITPKTSSSSSKVWVYFKQCDDDPNKVRCNLCSAELCNRGTTTMLWNHIKFKHSIHKSTPNEEEQADSPELTNMASSKARNITKVQRQKLDIIEYNELTLTSMKPLPSTSLSKNLISRLNQLSSPVTRKLKFWNKKSFQVNQYDPSFKVIYLGNLGIQLWSKEESCLDKPLNTLWNNYLVNMKTEIVMRLTICNSGLKAITRQHGLTQYWSNRLVYCCSHKNYPRIFSWIYRHEGKKMRQELRCHAVFCPSPEKAAKMVTMLNQRLACALQEFRREKKSRGIVNNTSSLQHKLPRTIPLRRQILEKGSANFRPPLERSKSAPKLTSILEEDYDLEEPTSQDEFEYEESFGDKDNESEYCGEEEELGKEDEDSTLKFESNSLTTTVNEETSNGSIYTTGDKHTTYDKQEPHANQSVKLNGLPESDETNRRLGNQPNSKELSQSEIDSRTKEASNDKTSNDKINSSHNNPEFQRSSANTNSSSSFDEQTVSGLDTKSQDSKGSFVRPKSLIKAKNNSTSNNRETQLQPPPPPDQAGEASTQDIILSWANFVIK